MLKLKKFLQDINNADTKATAIPCVFSENNRAKIKINLGFDYPGEKVF